MHNVNQRGVVDYILMFVVVGAVTLIFLSSFKLPPELESIIDSIKDFGGQVLGAYTSK